VITKEGLEKVAAELETLVQDRVFDADQKANEHRAPESYRTDTQGYSRGLHHMGFEIIGKLKRSL
jgi:hypothetical protein